MSGADAKTRWRKREPLVWRQIAGEGVILDFQKQRLRGLNSTAYLVFERLDGVHSLGEIAAEIAKLYEIDVETATRDVEAFVEVLQTADLVEQVT